MRFPRWAGDGLAPWSAAFDQQRLTELTALAPDLDPALAIALRATREALAAAGLQVTAGLRVALILGTSAGAARLYADYRADPPDPGVEARRALERVSLCEQAALLADRLGVTGPRIVVSTACASGTHAVGLARDLLLAGAADVALAVGSDTLIDMSFEGFGALGAMGEEPCAPFSQPEGVTLGEGAACLLLERRERARARGAEVLAEVAGFGSSSDAWHEAAPDPSGGGLALSLRGALQEARLQASDVGYINAHGTGTSTGDLAETLAIAQVFYPQPPTSSSKSQLGHTLGGAGALEAVVTVQALLHQALPPTAGFVVARRVAPDDPVGDGAARPATFDVALSTSSAFGGLNATVAFCRPGRDGPTAPPRRVAVAGIGLVQADPLSGDGRVAPFSFDPMIGRMNVRRLDESSRFLLQSCCAALRDAGLSEPRDAGDGIGLVVGLADGPQGSADRFYGSRRRGGTFNVSATAFARMVASSPPGAVARALQLRGPCTSLVAGDGAGLVALVQAVWWVGGREDVSAALACGVDELGMVDDERTRLGCETNPTAEGAGCVVLVPADHTSAIVVAGAQLAGPDDLGAAIERLGGGPPDLVCAAGSLHRGAEVAVDGAIRRALGSDVPIDRAADAGRLARAASGSQAVARAVQRLRQGEARRVLVVAASPSFGSAALLLVRED